MELFPLEVNLVNHGIMEEKSDYRAHVSFYNKTIYTAPTSAIRKAINDGKGRSVNATQPGVNMITSAGYVIPWSYIENLRPVHYPQWSDWDYYNNNLQTNQKGKLAFLCVLDCLRTGNFPIYIKGIEEKNKIRQIEGKDIIAVADILIQVKCDAMAGKTGNLYIEMAERNPRKLY